MSLINVANLTFAYDGSYDNIFENVSFQIDTAWKLGFTGRNGRGKTTFLNLLRGEYEYSGHISADVSFEYFPYPIENKENHTLNSSGISFRIMFIGNSCVSFPCCRFPRIRCTGHSLLCRTASKRK